MIGSSERWKKIIRSPLTWILIASVLLRVGAACYMGNRVEDLPGTADQISYHSLALRVMTGHGFSFDRTWWPITAPNAPTAHWSFLYTFYLAFVYRLFGPNPLAARILQAVIVGILQPYFTFLIARRLFNDRVGLIAAALVAVYTYFIYFGAALMTEPFYITAILASLYLAIIITDDPVPFNRQKVVWLAGLGLALGCVVLLRQLFLLFIPFLLLWMLWRTRKNGLWAQAARLAIPVAIVVLMILPFTIFNYTRFGRLVLLNTNSGYAFFWGNHPVYGTHFVGILTPEMGTYQSLIPEELRGLDEAALDSALMQRGMQFIIADPGRYILLCLSRIPVYFQFWPSPDSGMISNISRVTGFGLLLPFMIYGLVRVFLDGHASRLEEPVWVLLLFVLIYTGIHMLSWALVRYRLPVDAVMVIFAGYAVEDLYQRVAGRKRSLHLSEKPL